MTYDAYLHAQADAHMDACTAPEDDTEQCDECCEDVAEEDIYDVGKRKFCVKCFEKLERKEDESVV